MSCIPTAHPARAQITIEGMLAVRTASDLYTHVTNHRSLYDTWSMLSVRVMPRVKPTNRVTSHMFSARSTGQRLSSVKSESGSWERF